MSTPTKIGIGGCCCSAPVASHACGSIQVPDSLTCTYSLTYNSISAGGPATYTTTFSMSYVPASTTPFMGSNGIVFNGAHWAGQFSEYPIADDANHSSEFCKYTGGRMYYICNASIQAHHYMSGSDYPNSPYKTTLSGPPQSCLLGTLTNTRASQYASGVTTISSSPYHVRGTGTLFSIDITA